MAKTKTKETTEKILISPVFISFVVFVLATLVVYRLTLTKVDSAYDRQFIRDVLVEAHCMLFDILIIGTFIFALHTLVESRREKKRNIKRWQEEIDDFRGWNSEEAKFRIVGNIKRLNRNSITEIDIINCYLKNAFLKEVSLQGASIWKSNLKNANLLGANLQDADITSINLQNARLESANLKRAFAFFSKNSYPFIKEANFQGADFDRANLEDVNFIKANFNGANFSHAKLKGAILNKVNLQEAKNLTIGQLSKVKTLYKAKLDPELEKQIKEKYPHLLEKPEWLKED